MKATWFFTSREGINVATLSPAQAHAINGLQVQVEATYRSLCASLGESEDKAMGAFSQNFQVGDEEEPLNQLVFAFHGPQNALLTGDTRIVGFCRVFATKSEGDDVTCTSLAIQRSLEEETAFDVAHALFHVTQDIGKAFADSIRKPSDPNASEKRVVSFWRSQFATTRRVKDLFEASGFSTAKFQRVELTKVLAGGTSERVTLPERIEFKPFDLLSDDLARIYSVWELAYGNGTHPSIEAWRTHYLETPRLAAELSFVAWDGNTPVSGVFLEYIADGEGGGDAEVPRLMRFSSGASSDSERATPIELQFPEDYIERQAKIRAISKAAYVCAVGTLPAYRGQRLARVLLLKAFEQAHLAGLDTVFLSTNVGNNSAIKAYSAVGMKETKRMVSGAMTVAEI